MTELQNKIFSSIRDNMYESRIIAYLAEISDEQLEDIDDNVLLAALKLKNYKLMSIMIHRPFNWVFCDTNNNSLVHLAIMYGTSDIAILLINNIPKNLLLLINKNRDLAIHIAIKHRMSNVVMLLIDNMPKNAVLIFDKDRNTSFHLAIIYGMRDIAVRLYHQINMVAKHAVQMTNKDGKTALQLANIYGMSDICK